MVGKSYLVPVAQACTEAAGINDVHFRGDWRPIIEWLRQGLDPDDVIYPAIRDVVSRPGYQPGSIRSFAYFNGAVSDRAKAMQGGR